MRRKTIRVIAAAAVTLATTGMLTSSAAGAPPGRCDVGPSSLFDNATESGGDGLALVNARVTTTLDCPRAGVVAIDVWEHAVMEGFPDGQGIGALRGKAQILIDFTSAGVRRFKGQVRGTADCDGAGDCVVTMEIRAQSPGGAKLELQQSGVYRTTTGEWLFLELDGGILRKP
jgi:hypothetical protein